MAEFTIRTYGDPLLRMPGEPVREFGPPLRTLGEAMLSAMRKARGIGHADALGQRPRDRTGWRKRLLH
jgi:peptide deformylase